MADDHKTMAESHGEPLRTDAKDRIGSLAEVLIHAATQRPEHGVVTIGPDRRVTKTTFPELLAQAASVLAAFQDQGGQPGDVVVLYDLEPADLFPALWACLLGGSVPLPIAGGGENGVRRLLAVWEQLDQPNVLTCHRGLADLSADEWTRSPRAHVVTPWRERAVSALHLPPTPAPTDPALMLLSSGTTGTSKIVPLTHAGLLEFAAGSAQLLGWRPDEPTLNWFPLASSASLLLYHVFPVFIGSTNVHVPNDLILADPLYWLDLLSEHRVAHTWAPTFGYQLVRRALDDRGGRTWELSHLRTLVSGGEQVTPAVVEAFLRAVAPFGVPPDCFLPAWGMAETCTGITFGRYQGSGSTHRILNSSLSGTLAWAPADAKPDECSEFVALGRPAPGASIRVVDPRQQVLPERVIGRLQVRSRRVTPGYVGVEPADKWFDTGDLAYLHEGELVMTGREKDVLVLNGHNHSCQEIEEIVRSVPGVDGIGVAACGVPDPATGSDALAIFFTPENGVSPAGRIAEELFRRTRLTPRYVVPVGPDEFPRTATGKIRRQELPRLVSAASSSPSAGPARRARPPGELGRTAGGTTDLVRREVQALLDPDFDPADDAPFYELGLTSVGLTRLRHRLSELGFPLTASDLFAHPSVANLSTHLAGRSAVFADTEQAPRPTDDVVAVIGMALRFPGAADPTTFWENLKAGADCITTFDPAAQRAAGLSPTAINDPDRRPVGGALSDLHSFDPEFFDMSPKEASLTEPGHRLFLECCYEALEAAGCATGDRRIGVFAGAGMNLYGYQGVAEEPQDDLSDAMLTALGNRPDFLATRVAYRLGLTGPAVGVQTACSTSLIAVHLGIQALRAGDADLVLAGAAAVHAPQGAGYRLHPGSVLSASGRCRPFDAEADGTVGGNGVAAVLLKPLAAALADGDTVHAVISGSAINNDGRRKVGFAAPSVAGQVEVVRAALARAGISGEELCYIEAHGTGTPVGDPLEFEALSQAIGPRSERVGRCPVGSVKSSIGHLDSCSGMAGLIKVILMLRHRLCVATRNLERPNPALDLTGGPLTLATDVLPLAGGTPGAPLRAGVSSLGVGGTNAFVVVEEAPPPAIREVDPRPAAVPLSARNRATLNGLVDRLSRWLREHPETPALDVAATFAARPVRSERLAVVGGTSTELADALDAVEELGRAAPWHDVVSADDPPSPAFAFSGQGRLHKGVARELYDAFPVVRQVLDECDAAYREFTGDGLLRCLVGDDDPGVRAQPALFSMQMALAAMWRSWGLEPDCTLGHSMGELAALCTAGAFPVADGVRFTAARGRLISTRVAEGGMLAVRAEAHVARKVARQSGLAMAVCNGDRDHVLSGGVDALRHAVEVLDDRRIGWIRLNADRAYHSSALDPVLDDLRAAARECRFDPIETPVIVARTGTILDPGTRVTADDLVVHASAPVRFDLALAALGRTRCTAAVDIGPSDELSTLGRRALPKLLWSPTRRRGTDGVRAALLALADLYVHGTAVKWDEATAGGRRLPLPGVPFQRMNLSTVRTREERRG